MYDDTILHALPDPFTSREAFAAGLTQRVLTRLVRNGDIVRVTRGVFRRPAIARTELARWMQIREEHLTRARAALAAHPRHALSHLTNAVARGWPVDLHPEALVHLTAIDVRPRSRRFPSYVLHHSDSIINDVEAVLGLPALRPARTVVDSLRTMHPAHGVALADGALREGQVSLREVELVLESQRRWIGRPRACAALPLVDPRRESWLESYSFVALHGRGIELPTPQVEVYDERGRFVARVDGMWIADATVAEADGEGKYLIAAEGQQSATAESAAQRVVEERRRERALLDLHLQMVRWGRRDIREEPDAVARRVREARSRGDITAFRGRLRVAGAWLDLTRHPELTESRQLRG